MKRISFLIIKYAIILAIKLCIGIDSILGFKQFSNLLYSHLIYVYVFLSTSNRIPTSKNGSHVYFMLIVAMVLLLWRHIVLLWRQNNFYIKQ